MIEEIKEITNKMIKTSQPNGVFLTAEVRDKIVYYINNSLEEIERLNKTLEDIDTYIHLWKLEEIGEKTMLILNDILLIKNGMSDEVVRLKDSDK